MDDWSCWLTREGGKASAQAFAQESRDEDCPLAEEGRGEARAAAQGVEAGALPSAPADFGLPSELQLDEAEKEKLRREVAAEELPKELQVCDIINVRMSHM